MTEIYQAIELKIWQKDIFNLGKNNAGGLSETVVQNRRTRKQIQFFVTTEMRLLECLAFTGLYSDIIEFSPDHRDWLYEQPQFHQVSDDVLDRLSFLRTSDTSRQDKSYHFLHLTFQEYFAARYFVRCLISESSEPLLCLKRDSKGKYTVKISPEEFLQDEKYGGRCDVFWRFVTGLLHHTGEEKLSSFLEKIEREPRDLLGPAHQRLLMHCFSEIPQSELTGNGNDFLRRLRGKMDQGCIHWFQYEERSHEEMRLCSETEFPEHVLCKLLEEISLQRKSPHREKVLKALANRWHMSSKLIGIISNFLDDSDWHVRQAAIKALGTQSPWPPEILQSVTCRLDNSDWDVRQAAIKALGTQSPWPPEILQAVTRRLDASNRDMRQAAIEALGTQSPWPPEILQAVTCRLDDSDWHVRQAAIKALGTQSPWPPETLQAVTCRLNDSNWDVRQAAIEALGTQSPWPPEILQAVTCRLDDRDRTMVSKIEALLWKHDDFLSPFLHLHADAVSALCKIWVRRSIHETFVCYVWDGNVYFETSDGRRSLPLSRRKINMLQHTLWIATLQYRP
jgi:predicted metal-dependent hydrolase